jgi:hypothetical protein
VTQHAGWRGVGTRAHPSRALFSSILLIFSATVTVGWAGGVCGGTFSVALSPAELATDAMIDRIEWVFPREWRQSGRGRWWGMGSPAAAAAARREQRHVRLNRGPRRRLHRRARLSPSQPTLRAGSDFVDASTMCSAAWLMLAVGASRWHTRRDVGSCHSRCSAILWRAPRALLEEPRRGRYRPAAPGLGRARLVAAQCCLRPVAASGPRLEVNGT